MRFLIHPLLISFHLYLPSLCLSPLRWYHITWTCSLIESPRDDDSVLSCMRRSIHKTIASQAWSESKRSETIDSSMIFGVSSRRRMARSPSFLVGHFLKQYLLTFMPASGRGSRSTPSPTMPSTLSSSFPCLTSSLLSFLRSLIPFIGLLTFKLRSKCALNLGSKRHSSGCRTQSILLRSLLGWNSS